MIYSDAILYDSLKKFCQHPVFLTLGNIPGWKRNKPEAKELLGYLPVIQSRSMLTKNSQEFRRLCYNVNQKYYYILCLNLKK